LISINRKKILKIIKDLPAAYSIQDEISYKVTKKLERSRLPFLTYALLFGIGIFLSFFFPSYDQSAYLRLLKFPGMENAVVYFIIQSWIRFMIIECHMIMVGNENIILGLIIVLTVEFQKLRTKIMEIKAKLDEKSMKVKKIKSSQQVLRNKTKSKLYRLASERNLVPVDLNIVIETSIQEIVKKHLELLDIRDELENIFAPAFLLNFLCSTVCLCVFELMVLVAIVRPVDSCMFFFGASIKILMFFVLCRFCQKLKDASLEISDAIYNCKWEEIEDLKVKKQLLMILLRAQKSKTLTCWKFSEISFQLFGSVSF
jgi:hypothetical protein